MQSSKCIANYVNSDSNHISTVNLINNSASQVNLYYNGVIKGLASFKITSRDSLQIDSQENLYLFQSNKSQNFYIVYPGERLIIQTDKLGNLILQPANGDSVRNNELDIMRQANLTLPHVFGDMLFLYANKTLPSYPQKLETLQTYKTSIKFFLSQYTQKHKVSPMYYRSITDFLDNMLTFCELSLSLSPLRQAPIEDEKNWSGHFHQQDLGAQLNNIGYEQAAYAYLLYTAAKYYHQKEISKLIDDSLYYFAKRNFIGITRDGLLRSIVKKVIIENPNAAKGLLADFNATSHNSEFKEYLNNLALNNVLLTSEGNRDTLISLNKKKFDFKNLLSSLKGNVVCVDIWASWCVPCRAEIPSEKHLITDYKGKKVAFVNISIDDSYDDWNDAIEKEAMKDMSYSFILNHNKASSFINKYAKNGIPKYILISKAGEVANWNSPRPSDPKLKEDLDRLLAE